MRAVTTYVAFLRAINVGGQAVVRMSRLRDAFTAAGCVDARTFIASGNVVFEAAAQDAAALFGRIRVRVTRLLGRDTAVCFRTLAEIERLVRSDPFGARAADRTVKLYVAFLAEKPRETLLLPAGRPKEGLEAFGIAGREMFLVSRRKPNGFYGFPNTFVESLGVVATTRNWSTVRKIAEFAARPAPPAPLPAPRRRGRTLPAPTRARRPRTRGAGS